MEVLTQMCGKLRCCKKFRRCWFYQINYGDYYGKLIFWLYFITWFGDLLHQVVLDDCLNSLGFITSSLANNKAYFKSKGHEGQVEIQLSAKLLKNHIQKLTRVCGLTSLLLRTWLLSI